MLQRDTNSPSLSVSKPGIESHWAIRVSKIAFHKHCLWEEKKKKKDPVCHIDSISFYCLQPDEKGKFEGIFESLAPVNGLLSGDKVRPVLINSKLPLDVLGKVICQSDLTHNPVTPWYCWFAAAECCLFLILCGFCRFGTWAMLIKMDTWTKKNSQWWAAAISFIIPASPWVILGT